MASQRVLFVYQYVLQDSCDFVTHIHQYRFTDNDPTGSDVTLEDVGQIAVYLITTKLRKSENLKKIL